MTQSNPTPQPTAANKKTGTATEFFRFAAQAHGMTNPKMVESMASFMEEMERRALSLAFSLGYVKAMETHAAGLTYEWLNEEARAEIINEHFDFTPKPAADKTPSTAPEPEPEEEDEDEEDEEDPDPGYCSSCNGSGEGNYDGSICHRCNGSGHAD